MDRDPGRDGVGAVHCLPAESDCLPAKSGRNPSENAASAALPSAGVVAAVTAHLDLEGRIGSQAAFARAQDGLALARQRAATLFDCRPNQIALCTTCEQLWSLLFHAQRLPVGGRILASCGEWGGNLLSGRECRWRPSECFNELRIPKAVQVISGPVVEAVDHDFDGITASVVVVGGMRSDRVQRRHHQILPPPR
jgi:hypothetical protein